MGIISSTWGLSKVPRMSLAAISEWASRSCPRDDRHAENSGRLNRIILPFVRECCTGVIRLGKLLYIGIIWIGDPCSVYKTSGLQEGDVL